MFTIRQYFYNPSIEDKNNMYIDIIMDILIKRRNKLFTIYGILNMYSLSCKKKIDDIMNDKTEINNAINLIKNDKNIICYYYCKNDKLYYLFEYSITPTIRTARNNLEITINDFVDGYFASNIDINTIKNILEEPQKYINFSPQKISINNDNILKQLIISNEEKLLEEIIKKYNILITDNENGCGIKYEDLLNVAITSNNTNIVNIINKCYYEKKYEKINMSMPIELPKINPYFEYIKISGSIISIISFPFILYSALFFKCW